MSNASDDGNDVPQGSDEVLELYKVAVEGADKISGRRGTSNQFYLTLETFILGVPAVFRTSGAESADLTVLYIAGCIVSIVWWLQLRSYRQLNTSKFLVINAIEKGHFSVRPFSDEWSFLVGDRVKRWRDRYAELGTAERIVPIVFTVLNLFLIVRTQWN